MADNRLAKVWNGQRTDYVYDAADRLQFYVKPDGSVVAYDWDGNGNMVARTESNQTTQFEYDFDNRLVKITYPNGRLVRFGYDGLGRRVWRQEGNVVRQFYFDGDRIIAEREGNAWVVRYLLGLKPCGFVANGQVRVYHADRLGSVRWVTDGSQNIVASYVYEGFGKIVGQNGGGGGPYQFCGLWGYRNDRDAGLLHVGARYYEFETGRFIQKDLVLSKTKYVYCSNNPVCATDSDGKILVPLVIGAAAGAIIGLAFEAYLDCREDGQFNHSWQDYAIAAVSGAICGSAIAAGFGYILMPFTPRPYVVVVRWGSHVTTGSWVMIGERSIRNYLLSGVIQLGHKYDNYYTAIVPSSYLRYPPGWEWIKGLFGQRIYVGPSPVCHIHTQ